MAPPLTRNGPHGLLTRFAKAEDEIDSLLVLPTLALRSQLELHEGQVGWISNEALTHLARDARRRGDRARLNVLVPAWLRRCEVWLDREQDDVVDEALRQLAEWLADENSNRLDFFEVRFGRALKFLRAHARRTVRRRRVKKSESLDDTTDIEDPSTSELSVVIRERCQRARDAIERLEDPIRQAAILVWVMELTQVVAAERLGVSERTVRNYLNAARTQAQKLMEES